MRISCFVVLVCFVLSGSRSDPPDKAPRIVYGTYLGGSDKDGAAAIAVDSFGNAYVVGHTPSPDFPITAGAFSTKTQVNNDDWTGFVSKISQRGDHLLYSSFIGGNFRSSANAIAVDSTGRAFVVGSTCSSDFPTTRFAVLQKAPGSNKVDACDGFVAWLNAAGSELEYGTYLGGSREDAAVAVALAPGGGVIYVGGYTFSPDFPITGTAAQPKLNGLSNGFLSAIDVRSGQLLYSTYIGGTGNDRVTGIAVAPSGTVYVSGVTESKNWPNTRLTRLGELGATDGFVVQLDPTGKKRPFGIRFGGSGKETVASIDLDSHGDIYVAGSTDSPNFPVVGANLREVGEAFVVKINGRLAGKQAGVMWSRRLGGHGDDSLLCVSAGMPGSVFVSGGSGSKDFPTTSGAIYGRLEASNEPTLIRLRASDGRIQFATFVGGRHKPASWYNDYASGVFANANGDVYVAGGTLDDRLPVSPGAVQPQPKVVGQSEPFVFRLKFQVF
jgi:beta-propeller repeat-containing protein